MNDWWSAISPAGGQTDEGTRRARDARAWDHSPAAWHERQHWHRFAPGVPALDVSGYGLSFPEVRPSDLFSCALRSALVHWAGIEEHRAQLLQRDHIVGVICRSESLENAQRARINNVHNTPEVY